MQDSKDTVWARDYGEQLPKRKLQPTIVKLAFSAGD